MTLNGSESGISPIGIAFVSRPPQTRPSLWRRYGRPARPRRSPIAVRAIVGSLPCTCLRSAELGGAQFRSRRDLAASISERRRCGVWLVRYERQRFAAGRGSSCVCLPEDRSELRNSLQTLAQLRGLEVLSVDPICVLGEIQQAGAQL